MNDLFLALGIETWKPLVGALLLPPVPLLLLILAGALWLPRRRALGWTAVLLGVVGLWAASTTAVGFGLVQALSDPPPALTAAQITRLARAPRTAIVVLGGGIRRVAPEYASSDLRYMTLERLRYGIWLARQTGLPGCSTAASRWVGTPAPPKPTPRAAWRSVTSRSNCDGSRPSRATPTRTPCSA
jgi:hypothetical protein